MKMITEKGVAKEIKDAKEKPTPSEGKKETTEDMLKQQQSLMKGKIEDKELAEALRIAQEAEKAEEEEMMRRALEESQKLEQQAKAEQDEEEEMIKQAIEMSKREEEERKQSVKVVQQPNFEIEKKVEEPKMAIADP